MASLHLCEPPYPLGDTENDIRKDPKLCRTCWNLYGGSANTAIPLAGIAMHEHTGPRNAARAAQRGDNVDQASAWAGPGRIDYASWEINVILSEVPDAIKGGCVSCLLLYEALTKLTKGALDLGDPELWLIINFCKGDVMTLKLLRGGLPVYFDMFSDSAASDTTDRELVEVYYLYTLPGSPCPWPTIGSFTTLEKPYGSLPPVYGGPARHIEPDPSCEASFDMIKGWIKACKEAHAICSEAVSKTTRSLPKRVVDTGPESNDGIHLFEHDDRTQRIDEPYIALSHCWGKSVHFTSTIDTIDQWKVNIPFGSLSNTFKDAITISRKLGIRYIWIDSVCIIQGDKEDWKTEAAKMASIYHGADLVLSATGSVDGDGGCLSHREPFITVSGTFPDGKPFDIYGRMPIQHDVFGWGTEPKMAKGSSNPISGTPLGDVSDFPLISRAWCFQERLLATRILHYTKDEIVFDCLSSMECECGRLDKHEGDPLVPARRIIKTGHKYITGTTSLTSRWPNEDITPKRKEEEDITLEGKEKEDITLEGKELEEEGKDFSQHHELWRDLIVQYSQKQITYRADGLPAVGGLATKWSNNLTGKYLAGLWEKNLQNHMRWFPDEKDSGKELEYIAPSWSWLSAYRGVTWGVETFVKNKFFVEVDFDRTNCQLDGDNRFGVVESGHIFLTGRILPVTLSSSGRSLERKGHDNKSPFDRPDSLFRLRNMERNELFCLRFCTNQITMNAYDDDSALVLAKADPKVLEKQPREVREFDHVYQRVGFIRNYRARSWNHEREATKVSMYLI
ncbi:TOL [Fusarium albosuccineum]|uniref:TOL n=1 Tax=Fusarium albosuccineum TaxID=1237068 RepID=A0A8H4LFT9_9HYPO|nr:TOL [Fusarium albosuccineum]